MRIYFAIVSRLNTGGCGVSFYRNCLIAVCGLLIGAFQNCSNTSFRAGPGSEVSAKASGETLVPVTSEGDDDSNNPVDVPSVPPVAEHGHGNDHGNCQQPDDPSHEHPPVSADDEDFVACILSGPGKSVKLGLLTTDKLGGVNAVAESVCVSKKECETDVAAAFGGAKGYDRGYCEHNPNVQRLDDAKVKMLLGLNP